MTTTPNSRFAIDDLVVYLATGHAGVVTGIRRIVNGKRFIRVRLESGEVLVRPEEEWGKGVMSRQSETAKEGE